MTGSSKPTFLERRIPVKATRSIRQAAESDAKPGWSDKLRALREVGGIVPSRLLTSSPRLCSTLAQLVEVGSSHGFLFDRQNLGAVGRKIELGPPGRAELNRVEMPKVDVINLAANSYLGISSDPRVRNAAVAAIEQHGMHMGG